MRIRNTIRLNGKGTSDPPSVPFTPNFLQLVPVGSESITKSRRAHESVDSMIAMSLADQVAQSRTPFVVQNNDSGAQFALNNTADCAQDVSRCPLRFVLTDQLTRLCTALAFSKGARTIECADLLRVPATLLWVEWCAAPWERELSHYGFPLMIPDPDRGGRRGLLMHSSPDGRRGIVRSFWSGGGQSEPLASSVEAYFDFDASIDDEPEPLDGVASPILRVVDATHRGKDVLSRCVRFRYERSWQQYYDHAMLPPLERAAIDRHTLGTIAIMIPVVLAFLMLLGTRNGLPRRTDGFTRLNAVRAKAGKPRLLDHIEVDCPMIPAFPAGDTTYHHAFRRGPRLHHVRGHLVRRGNELHWRVPHLRGSARAGTVQSRTVTWSMEPRVHGAQS